MGIEVQVSDADMQVGRVLEAGYYQVRVSAIDTKPKKDKPSEVNFVVDFEVVAGQDGNGDASGLEIRKYFPGVGYMADLLKTQDVILSKGMKINLSGLVDHICDVYIKPGQEFNGRIPNEISSFAKLGEKFGR